MCFYFILQEVGNGQNPRKPYKTSQFVRWVVGWKKRLIATKRAEPPALLLSLSGREAACRQGIKITCHHLGSISESAAVVTSLQVRLITRHHGVDPEFETTS